jgi:hypothetical protein
VTKELGQGAYGIVWYARALLVLFCAPQHHHELVGFSARAI